VHIICCLWGAGQKHSSKVHTIIDRSLNIGKALQWFRQAFGAGVHAILLYNSFWVVIEVDISRFEHQGESKIIPVESQRVMYLGRNR
jgi:hypothetical protein